MYGQPSLFNTARDTAASKWTLGLWVREHDTDSHRPPETMELNVSMYTYRTGIWNRSCKAEVTSEGDRE